MIQKSMNLKHGPSTEPLHISVKLLFSNTLNLQGVEELAREHGLVQTRVRLLADEQVLTPPPSRRRERPFES